MQKRGEALRPIRQYRARQLGTPRERLYASVDKSGDCWVWTATRDKHGYGRLRIKGEVVLAHRLAWVVERGPIPNEMVIDHRCHNPSCVRVEHLQVADKAMNAENFSGVTSNNALGVRNVYFDKRSQRYVVEVRAKGINHYGGSFLALEEAAVRAKEMRLALHTNNLLDRAS